MNLILLLMGALLAQTASIEGRILQAQTNEPVRKANVELRALESDTLQYLAVTRDDGRFSFQNVKPGKYRMRASRQGFVTIEDGQRKANGRGNPIDVLAAQATSGMLLRMTPTGAISGRVYDADGQPVVKATVQALKLGYTDGKRALTVMQTALANDLGEYRLFWLPPGRYYLGAVVPDWNIAGDNITLNGGAPGSSVQGSRFGAAIPDPVSASQLPQNVTADTNTYLPIYFPNTTDEEAAGVLEVGAGATLSGMDLQVRPVRTRMLRGVALDAETGKPPAATPQSAQLVVSPRANRAGLSPFVNAQTGAFEATAMHAATNIAVVGGLKVGRVAIPIGETDIDGLQVVISAGVPLPGEVKVEGGATLPLQTLRLSLRLDPSTLFGPQPPPGSGVPAANGSFTIQNVTSGDYRVLVTPLLNAGTLTPAIPEPLKKVYVKSMRYGDVDVLNNVLQIRGRPENALLVVLGTDASTLSGTVINADQKPAPESTVALVPANRTRFDLFRSAATDAAGAFKLERIPPGEYKMFAWEDVDTGAWFDPQFLKTFEDRGILVTVSGDKEYRLPLIPMP